MAFSWAQNPGSFRYASGGVARVVRASYGRPQASAIFETGAAGAEAPGSHEPTYNLMISSESLSFLKKLLDTPGPSGFEAAPAKVWREQAKAFAKVSGDVAGNSLAEVNSGGKPTIMLAGHIDEIGVIVNYVDDQGFAYIQPIGGWD